MGRTLLLVTVLLLTITFSFGQQVEGEDGILTGTEVASTRQGYSGTGYVTGFDQDGDAVSMKISVSEAGLYNLWVGYAAPYGEKTNSIFVNGESKGDMVFPETSSFKEGLFGKITLNEGQNTIKIVKSWGYFEVDYIRVNPTAPAPINNFPGTPVNPDASAEAKILYQYLADAYGKRIISGQQNESNYTATPEKEFEYILEKTGKQPAIRGFDFIDYSPSRVEHGTSSNETGKIIEWHEKGGIATAAWHWNAPKDLYDTDTDPWWSGFYTRATGFDLSIAMNDENSEEYDLIIRDMDVIAGELKRLRDENIPVLWRPLHEAEGAWFWWGAKGPEPCKWLWKLMYKRYVEHHQLNNLIWVWTTTDSPAAPDWYPGNEYVDIVSADIYLDKGDYSPGFAMFDNIADIFEGARMIALSETGMIPDPDRIIEEKAKWSWFCTWSGDFILDPENNSVAHIQKVYNHEYVITLDELPDFGNYESPQYDDPFDPVTPPDPVTGLNDEPLFFQFYPNPVEDKLTISNEVPLQLISLTIADGVGRTIFSFGNDEMRLPKEIDFRNVERGTYFVRIVTDRMTKTIKIIKN